MKAYQTIIKTVRRIGIGANMRLETDEAQSISYFGDHTTAQKWMTDLGLKHVITHETGEEQYIGEFEKEEAMSLLSDEIVETQYFGNIVPIEIK